MGRIDEYEGNLLHQVNQLKLAIMDLKSRQITSVRSGIQTYQIPTTPGFDQIIWTDDDDNVSTVSQIPLVPTGGPNDFYPVDITVEYEPLHQPNPIIYPFLTINYNNMEAQAYYSASLGLGFITNSLSGGNAITYDYLEDITDYSNPSPIYKWRTGLYYSTNSAVDSGVLKLMGRLRSSDRGNVTVKAKTWM